MPHAHSTMTPSHSLQGRSAVSTMRSMVSRRNIDALTELGNRRRALRAELEEVEAQIDKNLRKTYLEGWTWDELVQASSLTLQPLNNRLRKLGLLQPGVERSKDAARTRKAQVRKDRTATPKA